MRNFLARRLIFAIVSIFGATVMVFLLSRWAGDPLLLYANPEGYGLSVEQVEAISKKLALDRPLVIQYGIWVGRMAQGDLGNSLQGERPVSRVIWEKMGATSQLALAGWLLATLIGIPMGILSAVKRGTAWDYVGRTFALFGQAVPNFWLGIISILIFSVMLGWLPPALKGDGISIKHFILPAVTVGTSSAAAYLRITRSSMLEVLDSEYIKLARAKGVGYRSVIWKHAFRNALVPPITISALVFAGLLTGTVAAEVVFAWPGIGRTMIQAVFANDFPVLTGIVLVFVLIYMLFSLLSDLLYALVDPRIRYS